MMAAFAAILLSLPINNITNVTIIRYPPRLDPLPARQKIAQKSHLVKLQAFAFLTYLIPTFAQTQMQKLRSVGR